MGIIQARFGSNRFPGKVLHDFLGQPILCRVLSSVGVACGMENVVVATGRESHDDPVASLAKQGGWKVHRGSPDNVWSRFHEIVLKTDAQWVLRISADSPLMSASLIQTMIGLIQPKLDLVTNIYRRSFPHGQSVEILHRRLFLEERFFPQTKEDKEHVTPQLYRLPGVRLLNHLNPKGDQSHLRWSVEEPGDIERLEKLTRG